jgi:peptide deformylase
MALRNILTYPHPVLKAKARPIADVDDGVKRLIDDMVETMYDAPGVGLAAPQVGEGIRLCVVDVGVQDDKAGSDLLVLVNPVIVAREGKIVWTEGCLSVPDFEDEMQRSAKITVEALGRDGKPFQLACEQLKAVCIQHEMDHLDGVTIADRVSFLKRSMYLQKVKKGKIAPRRRGERGKSLI